MKFTHGALRALLVVIVASAAWSGAVAAQAIYGELRDRDGDRPLPGARLYLLSHAGEPVDSTRADRSARYRMTAPAAGEYTVHFRLDGWADYLSDPIRLDAGDAVRFDFRVPLVATAAVHEMSNVISMEARLRESIPELCGEPFRAWEAGLLVGVVRARAGRTPIAGATVTVLENGDIARSTRSSENGIYVLCNVPVGPAVRISVQAPGLPAETTDVEIRAGTASWYDMPVGPRRR